MPSLLTRWSRLTRLPVLLSLALLFGLAACGDDDDDGGTGPTDTEFSYVGPFASASSSGVLQFGTPVAALRADRMALVAPISITGTMTFTNGSTIALSGTLDGTVLALTGSGYTFSGVAVNDNVISGSFTGPGGETGTFSATLTSADAAVKVLCGVYNGDDSGVFSLALLPDRTGSVIVGSQTGTVRPKSGTSNQVQILPDAAPTFVLAEGTLSADGNSIAGNWEDPSGASGGFEGSVAACSAPSATTFTGYIASGGALNGGIVLKFNQPPGSLSAQSLVAGSVITPQNGATPLALTGVVLANGGFSATDQLNSITLEGQLENGSILGNWAPTGSPFPAGYFRTKPEGVPYCGSYTQPGTTGVAGYFNLLVAGSSVTGFFQGVGTLPTILGSFESTASTPGTFAYAATGRSATGTYDATANTMSGTLNWTGANFLPSGGTFTITEAPITGARCLGT